MTSPLDAPLKNALGPRTSAALAKGLGLHTVGDLLSHYPRRYIRRGELTELTHLPLDENVTIVAEVKQVVNQAMADIDGDGYPEVAFQSGFAMQAANSPGLNWIARSGGNPRQPWKT